MRCGAGRCGGAGGRDERIYHRGVILATNLEAYEGVRRGLAGGCVLVPTMGALHEGHASLVRQGAAFAAKHGLGGCVVTVFVNPTQFGDPADFSRYPKTLEADCKLCEAAGAACVLAPGVEDVYPPGAPTVVPPLPRVATEPGLEDALRPGHFAGVCQVVKRLFEITRPAAAVFGEKDWQQLAVVSAMVRELGMGIEIVPGPTVRDADGMAMSSRNRFLSAEDRARGLSLSRALRRARGAKTPDDAEAAMRDELAKVGVTPDYAVVRNAATLGPRREAGDAGPWRAVIAAKVGSVRLLDNAAWGVG
ncbi:MAG: pantoate--beta-alanine ligase [Tepidisphaera sp.]|nr:pantoate--beta-alanine ligase [Tepidisphaera sp.]